jgi:uncharacterized protein
MEPSATVKERRVTVSKSEMSVVQPGFPWLFFLLTYVVSWGIWIPFIVAGGSVPVAAVIAGNFAPSLIGALLASLSPARETRRDFWRRAFGFTRIGGTWYVVIFLIFPVTLTVSILVAALSGTSLPSLEGAARTLSSPLSVISFLIIMVLGGPLAEELGWRGFALDRIQARWSALSSSLVLGLIWGVWHFPFFFMKGTVQASMGFGSGRFFLWFAQLMALAVLLTWVYNNNKRSTMSAILLHFMSNSTITLIYGMGNAPPTRILFLWAVFCAAAAVIAVAAWGPSTMAGRRQDAGGHRLDAAEGEGMDS